MARTRSLDDEQVLQRVADALGEADNTWTLAGAAAAAGVHPATLIKRFGSRRGLLVALSKRWVDSIPTGPTSGDAHQELLAWIDSTCASDATGDRMLTRIDMLVEDLRDPELRALLHHGWQRTTDYLTTLIDRSRRSAQEPLEPSSASIAQLLLDTVHGSLLRTAVAPDPAPTDRTCTARTLLEALT